MKSMSRMYIFVKDSLSVGKAITAVAHASLMVYLEYKEDSDLVGWLESSFKKVVCSVTEEQFEQIKDKVDRIVVVTESSLDGVEVAIGCCPREQYPKMVKYLPLYK